jgi:phosphomannomutase
MDTLLLFDVDGTIAESGQEINPTIKKLFNNLIQSGFKLGIVGGGKLDKVLQQLGNTYIHHYFTECGCVYHKNQSTNLDELKLDQIYVKNIREHELYPEINKLIKKTLLFLSSVDYTLTGHFIDLRNGIIYISLIGLTANNQEREYFLELDKINHYRKQLLDILHNYAKELNIFDKISIFEGGTVGIAIYPIEYDKSQVLSVIDKSNIKEIHYFGDKYLENGNDQNLLNNHQVIGHCIDSIDDTIKILEQILYI